MTDSDSSDSADAQQNSALDTALDATDPIAREADTFPRLSDEMLARIARYGSEERFVAGAPIYSRGDRNVDFFVVVEGSIEILDVDDYDKPRVFLVLRSHQFSGELNLFNEREVLVSARAGEASRLLRIPRADFRRLVSIEADIGEIVMRAFILRRVNLIRHVHGGVVVIGPAHTADTLRLIQFLSRNAYPHRLVDTEHDAGGDGFLDCFSLAAADLPVVIAPGHRVLRKPSLAQLADDLGLTETFDHAQVFDLAVVGAGPAGLAAAVYASSEGLSTVVLESEAVGGQAGTSSMIRNYLGFPRGISGMRLAQRARNQAIRFGTRFFTGWSVTALEPGVEGEPFVLHTDGGDIRARSVVVSTGVTYRKLGVASVDAHVGLGVFYGSAMTAARETENYDVVVVGGGNSAGQAAIHLSRFARSVTILVRREGLEATMSSYLIGEIAYNPRISVLPCSEVVDGGGEGRLEWIRIRDTSTGQETTRDCPALFMLLGAEPHCDWLPASVERDDRGFVLTGRDIPSRCWADGLPPANLETTVPGVFAAGDIRAGSMKRVAAASGEGASVVPLVHTWLEPAG